MMHYYKNRILIEITPSEEQNIYETSKKNYDDMKTEMNTKLKEIWKVRKTL